MNENIVRQKFPTIFVNGTQILWLQHDRYMHVLTTTVLTWQTSTEQAACRPCAMVSLSSQSIKYV